MARARGSIDRPFVLLVQLVRSGVSMGRFALSPGYLVSSRFQHGRSHFRNARGPFGRASRPSKHVEPSLQNARGPNRNRRGANNVVGQRKRQDTSMFRNERGPILDGGGHWKMLSGPIIQGRCPLNLASSMNREARGPFRIERDCFDNAPGPAVRRRPDVHERGGIAQAIPGRNGVARVLAYS
jgi:hypothetical protein